MGKSVIVSIILLGCYSLALAQTGAHPPSTAVGDLNGDSKPDLVVANGSLSNIGVFLNNGSGGLGPGKFFAVAHPAISVQLADFNSDGHLDILVVEQTPAGTSPLEILFGDGTGSFSAPVSVPVTSAASTAAVVADFNGDGKADIAFVVNTTSTNPAFATVPTVGVILGDGKGGFSAPILSPIAYNSAFIDNLTVVDVNKDGKPDLVVDTGSSNPLGLASFLAINNGAGAFISIGLAGGTDNGNLTTFGDFNGDPNVDFLAAGTFLFGDGQGGVLYTTTGLLPITQGTAVDLDNDGKTDLLVNAFSYQPGNGAGGFGDIINFLPPPANPANVIAIADLNGDGRPDLILQNNGSTDVAVFQNNLVAPVSISASTLTNIEVSAATTSVGANVTLAGLVFSNGGTPTGTVTFKDATTTLGTAPTDIYGIAALTTSFPAGGLHGNLTASFVGTLNAATNTFFGNSDTAASPAAISVNNTPPTGSVPAVTLTSSPNPVFELNQVLLSSKVSSASGTPTGNVTFLADGEVIGIEPVGISILVNFPTSGLHNIQAVYGGDGTFPSATSATLVEDVRAFNTPRGPTTTQVTATPGPNGGLILKSQVSGGAIQPTGSVAFRANGGFVTLFPPGQQVFFNFAPGTYQISATYLGDAALAPSSATVTAVVGGGSVPGGDFSLSSSPQSATVKAGQSASFTITLSPAGGFNSATSFACTGLPAGAACSFSPATLTPSGAPVSTTLTFTTTAPGFLSARLTPPNVPWPTLPGMALVFGAIASLWSWNLWNLNKPRKLARLSVAAALLFVAGCGSGSKQLPPTSTPAGTFQVMVTATSSTTHNLPISITVTP